MPRRTVTMLCSTLTLIALLCTGLLMPVPYSELAPGPTVNTLGKHDGDPVLQIDGHRTYPTSGHLNMTTVQVTGADYRMNLVEAMAGWIAHDGAVVPHDTLYPDDKSAEEVDQENAEEFTASQESAKVAALEALDIPVGTRVIVSSVVKGGAAEGELHAGDVILAVDGEKVREPADVVERVTRHSPGEKAVFTVVPASRAKGKGTAPAGKEVSVTTRRSPDDGRAVVGIQAGTEHTFPFDIEIELADVGGPSAGLMFALGLIDKLDAPSLTGGRFVAGTGTIDDDGTVGPIGGITMKTIAAREAGAEYFLTPADNCAAAAADTPEGLTLVEVEDLDGALDALALIREGKKDRLPTCRAAG
ncbi:MULTISPECIES: PDZ domain-containing protein [Streptomyces]|uniref:YlbL family protein n=1 Tax=Streptomyces TaxID=1883 RepID=UPI0022AB0C09|nr:PDZ domain-containing protein [Streptomyces sp. HB2AG]MCZ2525720.1 PDZ domain-containing protein [Streptomyces sp. HB2AG]